MHCGNEPRIISIAADLSLRNIVGIATGPRPASGRMSISPMVLRRVEVFRCGPGDQSRSICEHACTAGAAGSHSQPRRANRMLCRNVGFHCVKCRMATTVRGGGSTTRVCLPHREASPVIPNSPMAKAGPSSDSRQVAPQRGSSRFQDGDRIPDASVES